MVAAIVLHKNVDTDQVAAAMLAFPLTMAIGLSASPALMCIPQSIASGQNILAAIFDNAAVCASQATILKVSIPAAITVKRGVATAFTGGHLVLQYNMVGQWRVNAWRQIRFSLLILEV